MPPPPPMPAPNAAQLAPTTYAAISMQRPFLVTNQPPLVPVFDASKPPPPLLKRKIYDNGSAVPSKLRIQVGPDVSETHCESCAQRKSRIEVLKQQMDSLHNEEEIQILSYKNKLQEYETGKEILKTIVGPQLFTALDGLIEGSQTPQVENSNSSTSDSSTVSEAFLQLFQMCLIDDSRKAMDLDSSTVSEAFLQLFPMCLIDDSRKAMDLVPSTSQMDEALRFLTSLSRRHNISLTNPEPDMLEIVVNTLRNSNATEPSVEKRPNEPPDMTRMNRTNGFMTNGQKAQASGTSEAARYGVPGGYGAPSAAGAEYGARLPPAMAAMPGYSVAGPSGYAAPAPPPAAPAPPPAAYPVYHPAIPPPPNRSYYAQGPDELGTSNLEFNGAERAKGPVLFQEIRPTPTSVTPRLNHGSVSNYWYPQPSYFPSYQKFL